MRTFIGRNSRARQRGWIGIVMLLVGLLIVVFLAKEAMKQFGLIPSATATKAGAKTASPGERARAPGATEVDAADVDSTPVAPASAIE